MKRKPTKRSPEGQQSMDEFKALHIGKRCWLCERERSVWRHHIVFRKGDEHDDLRNLLAVCLTCHRRIHDGEQTLVTGRKLPGWKLDDVLRAKRRHDPDNYDPEFLDRLAHPERLLREFFSVKETE